MFTGIVSTGVITGVVDTAAGRAVRVRSSDLADAPDGASVSIDGVCLTVTERDGDTCRFDLSPETLERSTLGGRAPGDVVNVERPLRAGAELGGHIVQGHVDGVGRIERATPEGDSRRVAISIPPPLMRYLVEKGSVTVDGVSLTVAALEGDVFEVALVPHTLASTTFGGAEAGRLVNIEVDVLAKYVERLVAPMARTGVGDTDEGYL